MTNRTKIRERMHKIISGDDGKNGGSVFCWMLDILWVGCSLEYDLSVLEPLHFYIHSKTLF